MLPLVQDCKIPKEVKKAMNVSVGKLKKDLSSLLNQVAYGNQRVVVESRGKPKAVLISMEELERLESGAGLRETRLQAEDILKQLDTIRDRQGAPANIVDDLRALREGRAWQ